MEKRGERRGRTHCRRLLILFFCIFRAAVPLAAADVGIYVSSFEIPAGGTLTVEFTVLNTDPADAALELSGIPESFSAVSGRKERRILNELSAPDGRLPVTVIAQDWVVKTPGSISLGPFTIIASGERVPLPPIHIVVTAPISPKRAALRWILPKTVPGTGRPHRIALEGSFVGSVVRLSCPAPENALLDEIPISGIAASETGWIPLSAYDWTPLSSGTQDLPSAVLEYTDESGAIHTVRSTPRAVSVTHSPSSGEDEPIPDAVNRAFAPPSIGEGDSEASLGEDGPETSSSIRPELPPEFSEIPWAAGGYAEILAGLRRAEYTRLFPRRYRSARLVAESRLGFGETISVAPAAWRPYSVIGSVLLFAIGFLLKILPIPKTLRRMAVSFFSASALLVIFALFVYTRNPGTAGVSKGSWTILTLVDTAC